MKPGLSLTCIAGLFAPAIALLGIAFSMPAFAQTIRVRLLNAKNGRAIAKRYVSVYWNGTMEHADLMTDSSGTAIFSVPPSATEFSLMGGGTEKEPYRTVYADCGDPFTTKFPISTATQIGIVTRNRCGHASVLARPGEVVYWALPLSWLAQQFQ